MAHPVPPHLVLHYQILGLRIGASFDEVQNRTQLIRQRFDGRSNLVKVRKAYEALRGAHLASKRPPPESETVDQPSQSQEQAERYQLAPAGRSVKPPLQPPSVQLQVSSPCQHPPRADLSLHPKYKPQGGSQRQASSQMSPGFAIHYSQSNIFDAAEDRAVLVRE
jgi:hypothetical protein